MVLCEESLTVILMQYVRFTLFSFLAAIFVVFQSISLFLGTLKAAVHLHEYILKRVFRLPMMYFDKTPVGRILNRFSYDINVCDNGLPRSQQQALKQWSSVGWAY